MKVSFFTSFPANNLVSPNLNKKIQKYIVLPLEVSEPGAERLRRSFGIAKEWALEVRHDCPGRKMLK